MEIGDHNSGDQKWWGLLWIVFSKLDARSLSLCCCVSQQWRHIAKQEELWQALCAAAWPGLAVSDCGRKAVSTSGGYRKFFATRMAAAASGGAGAGGAGSGRSGRTNLRLKLRDLVFLLDVHYKNSPVCSMARPGNTLKRMFPAGVGAELHCAPRLDDDQDEHDDGTFRFVVEIPTVTSDDRECGVWIGRGGGQQQWSKKEIRDFTVSWAVMLGGSPTKVFQILQSRQPGQVVGNTCNYSERLPIHSCCCCLSDTNHVAEVDLYFSSSPDGGLFLRELRCSILNTDCWRYFTQVQALQYLQHALHHV